eukprot:CAMPEP_0204150422 /NCGR_PEP_ID=MMETSP0361-20130328/25251_1 /ASSEMBLY_ACC=CAM_ASM_000343 /TAXON_ID=268821 /ORGANISM="Scrippsiella Hangoei, Strain SHTV-5" /LENGTH=178 /DNA_ID=CAMNT_0051105087 /DNA_START=1 /DNA_END=533 /DNA_ORIENTATION=+
MAVVAAAAAAEVAPAAQPSAAALQAPVLLVLERVGRGRLQRGALTRRGVPAARFLSFLLAAALPLLGAWLAPLGSRWACAFTSAPRPGLVGPRRHVAARLARRAAGEEEYKAEARLLRENIEVLTEEIRSIRLALSGAKSNGGSGAAAQASAAPKPPAAAPPPSQPWPPLPKPPVAAA